MRKTAKTTPWSSDAVLRDMARHLKPGQILPLWPPEKGMLKEPMRMWRLTPSGGHHE